MNVQELQIELEMNREKVRLLELEIASMKEQEVELKKDAADLKSVAEQSIFQTMKEKALGIDRGKLWERVKFHGQVLGEILVMVGVGVLMLTMILVGVLWILAENIANLIQTNQTVKKFAIGLAAVGAGWWGWTLAKSAGIVAQASAMLAPQIAVISSAVAPYIATASGIATKAGTTVVASIGAIYGVPGMSGVATVLILASAAYLLFGAMKAFGPAIAATAATIAILATLAWTVFVNGSAYDQPIDIAATPVVTTDSEIPVEWTVHSNEDQKTILAAETQLQENEHEYEQSTRLDEDPTHHG